MTTIAPPKQVLNLAAGNRLIEDAVNHDRYAHRPEISVTHDLRNFPWPWADNSFDEIVAFDIIEHVPDALPFIEELWRIARPGARISIHTAWAGPDSNARAVWRDPTHIRPYHEDSFMYFDPINGGYWFSQYGTFYSHARFQHIEIQKQAPDCILFELKALKE